MAAFRCCYYRSARVHGRLPEGIWSRFGEVGGVVGADEVVSVGVEEDL